MKPLTKITKSTEVRRKRFSHGGTVKQGRMTGNEITDIVFNTCLEIHRELGPGLFESVYEHVLNHELLVKIERQLAIPLIWKGQKIDETFRADLIVENKVILELKSVEKIAPVHKKQVLTYLKLTGMKLGLLINFRDEHLKNGFSRVINGELI